jgi:hypothetical protein
MQEYLFFVRISFTEFTNIFIFKTIIQIYILVKECRAESAKNGVCLVRYFPSVVLASRNDRFVQ